jgi:oligopeptide transport system substrate-binding protein
VIRESRPRQFLTVARSPTYWNHAAVTLEAVRFFPIDNQQSDEAAFRTGQLHKTFTLPPLKAETWRREHPELLHTAQRSGTYYYGFNVTRPPFNDVRVRRALALAVDRETLVRNVTRGGAQPAYHFTRDGTGGYVCRTNLGFDPGEARRLLAAAGFPEGRGFPHVSVLYNTSDQHRVVAEAVQQMWRSTLGVDIQLRNQEWGVYLATTHALDYDIMRAGLLVEPYDPWLFLRSFTTGYGFNLTGWSNPEYDRRVAALEAAADPATREALAQQCEALLMEEVPIIPFFFHVENYLLDASVRGWCDNSLDIFPLAQVGLQN